MSVNKTAPSEQQWRANTYSLLANLLLGPPDKAILNQLSRIPQTQGNAPQDPMIQAWVALAKAATTATPNAANDEYHNLFIGLTGGEIMPYASWYLTGFLMEKPLATLRDDLRRIGIKRRPHVSEPEDHAAALFEVMNLLIVTHYTGQTDFFNAHLRPWMGTLFQDIENAASAVFYRSVAQLGSAFMDLEQTLFDIPR